MEFSDKLRDIIDNDLDEVVILALEAAVVDYIKFRKRRLDAWRAAIESKLSTT